MRKSDFVARLAAAGGVAVAVAACGLAATAPTSVPSASPPPAGGPSASVELVGGPSASSGWTVVALGDSVASEAAATGASYPHLYAKAIEELTGRNVDVVNLADGSTTSGSLLASLQDARSELARTVATADIVTITAGGNDADPFATYPAGTCAASKSAADCLATYNPGLEANYRQMLSQISTLRRGQSTVIRVTSPDYNPFIGWKESPSATFGIDFYRQVATAETEVVCRVAPELGAACADFLTAFNGEDGTVDAAPYLTSDHAHPGDAGRRVIADILASTGLAPAP